jgi:hypothetical protein
MVRRIDMTIKVKERAVRIGFALLLMTSVSSWSQATGDVSDNVVFRDGSGEWSAESMEIGKILVKRAEENKTIVLRITADYPFNFRFDQMTNKEIRIQEKEVRQLVKQIVEPLAKRSQIFFEKEKLVVTVNGARVIATPAGVKALLSDYRVLHMVETNPHVF